MPLKKASRLITVIGILLIWAIKFLVRPFVYIDPVLKPLVGMAPNLIGSFLLPFGACWFFQRIFRLETTTDLNVTCFLGLLLVVINEYLQLISFFGRTFDYFDIVSSVVGVLIGHWYFKKLMFRYPRVALG